MVGNRVHKILFVGIDPALGEKFKSSVCSSGWSADVIQNDEEALSLLAKTSFDAVAIDFHHPGGADVETARRILAGNEGLPVLILAGKGDAQLVTQAMKLGIVNYVIKDDENVCFELIPGILADLFEQSALRQNHINSESALRLSETRFRDFAEIGADWFWELDADLRFIFVSGNISRFGVGEDYFLGKTLEEILGSGLENTSHAEEIALQKQHLSYKGIEKRSATRSDKWVQSSANPVFDHENRFIGYRGATVDITDRKQSEFARNESAERFRNLSEGSIQGILVYRNNTVLYANEALCRIFGYETVDQVLALGSITELVHPEERAKSFENVKKRAAGEDIGTIFEYKGIRADGTEFWFESSNRNIGWSGQQAAQATIIDVTARKTAEETERRRQETENRFRTVVNSSPAAISLKDHNGNYLLINDTYARWMNSTPAELEGKNVFDIYPPDQAREIEAFDSLVIASGENTIREVVRAYRHGEVRNLIMHKAPVRSADGLITAISSTSIDISDRKHLEDQLRQSQRMEAVGQLTGGVAHDFNNLLAVMMMNAEVLDLKTEEDPALKENVEAIKRAVDQGSSLTSRLLSYSRKQALSSKTVALNGLVLGMEDMLQRTLGESIKIGFDLANGSCPAYIDPHQFENALLNLSINARDAMPNGGHLNILTKNVTVDETSTNLPADLAPGDYVRVGVRDEGTGILAEDLGKVFEPFFTTKGVGEGSGLGLSMVYGFVKQSNGEISINSEPGQGTTVNLYLPRVEKDAEAEIPDTPHVQFGGGSERILVVEDNEELCEVVTEMLSGQGYEISKARDGETALEILNGEEDFDLLFTDIALPGSIKGQDVAEEARRIQPEICILFTTGHADIRITQNGIVDPELNLLTKPYRREELLGSIRAKLDDRTGKGVPV